MKVLSLFSGVGGFDLGLENAGMETVFQCEWDKHATSILQRHWPDVPRWGDITTLTGRHILDHAPVIDVVAWGSPCQDLSVAGKRAGLSGSRSGLFHEGIRIIKELRKETNNAYPRISIWENVYGALNSNKGADFGLVLDEMAEAGAMVIEWRVLDAQYFGVPQRRRRVFVVAVFDPRIAANCPDPLLPLRQGVQWNPATSRTTRQTTPRETEQSLASGRGIANTIAAELYHHASVTNQDANNGHLIIGTALVPEWWSGGQIADTITTKSDNQRMPDKNRLQVVIGTSAARDYKGVENQYVDEGKMIVEQETFTGSSFAQYTEGVGTLRSNGGDLGGGSETVVVEPFVKAKRAQSTSDDETWVEGDINPTINQFDQGDVRATTAIVMRQREGKPGGGKGPLLSEDKSLTLAAAGNDQTLFVEQPIVFDDDRRVGPRIFEETVGTLQAFMGTGGNNTPMVAIPIQDGREIEKNQNGLGIAESGAPAYTLDQTGAQSVAIGIQGNVIGRQDHNGPAGKGHTEGAGMAVAFTTEQTPKYNTDQALTLTSQSPTGGGQPQAVMEPTMSVRRLTPLECERLMGWPDDWTAGQADTHRYKQCGNGVASPVAQWIGEQILNIPQ